jgi:hypothetical protein
MDSTAHWNDDPMQLSLLSPLTVQTLVLSPSLRLSLIQIAG